jgi:hypothetical protein
MAAEYNRALKAVLRESFGVAGMLRVLAARQEPPRERLAYALLSAERLCAMLAYVRAAEALVAHGATSAPHRRWAERFVHRSLPLVRMHGSIVRSGDRSTLDGLSAS